MGNDRGRPDEQPARVVTVRRFKASLEPVSNGQYAAFLEATGHEQPRFWGSTGFDRPGQPVVGVNWHDAQAYCGWLTTVGVTRYRLPTEAEREFAALGGAKDGSLWPWGDAPPDACPGLASIAVLNEPHEPREGCSNGFGLRCMTENVHEWCADWYVQGYPEGTADNPTGPSTGTRKASRGGSWRHSVKFTRVSARSSLDPTFRYNDYGFRVYADA